MNTLTPNHVFSYQTTFIGCQSIHHNELISYIAHNNDVLAYSHVTIVNPIVNPKIHMPKVGLEPTTSRLQA